MVPGRVPHAGVESASNGATVTTPSTRRASSSSSGDEDVGLEFRDGDVLGIRGVVPVELLRELPRDAA